MSRFSGYIAKRYIKGHGRLPLNFSNLLSLAGIGIGVFSLIVVISVMNGFDTDIRSRIISFRSDIKVSGKEGKPLQNYTILAEKIEQLPYIKYATPVITNELLIQSEDGIFGAICNGIDFPGYSTGTELKEKLLIGHPDKEVFEDNGIILGFDLAIDLNVSVHDYVQLSAPIGTEATPFGLMPRNRRYKVVSLFSAGIPDYDQYYCFFPLSAGQYFSGYEEEVDCIEVRSVNANRSWHYRRLLSQELGSEFRVEDWSDYEANLFNAIKMEKVLMILVLSLIILLAGFNMAGNLNRLVSEKKRDIGILQAYGVKSKVIRGIFLNSSVYIGISGIVTGITLSYIFLLLQMRWQFIKIPISGFPIKELPIDMRWSDFVIISLIAFVITLLLALVPASKSRNISTIEVIREKR